MNHFKAFAVALAMAGLAACSSDTTSSPPPPPPTLNPQGFEANVDGWVHRVSGEVVPANITRVASNAGTLHLPAGAGAYYAELQNNHDEYQAGYGNAGNSYFAGKGAAYEGDFYQAIDVYVDPTWGPAGGAFWIDMTPNHADPDNYGAEHNFHLTGTTTQVNVTVDGQVNPIATITAAGWYTFLMTFEKAGTATDPVVTHMAVLDSDNVPLGAATVYATSPGGPFASSDLLGSGYVWITVWTNGFAGDVVGIDNVRTGLLPYR